MSRPVDFCEFRRTVRKVTQDRRMRLSYGLIGGRFRVSCAYEKFSQGVWLVQQYVTASEHILDFWPDVEPLLVWQGVGENGLPERYLESARYWYHCYWKGTDGVIQHDRDRAWACFRRSVLAGALSDDDEALMGFALTGASFVVVERWLISRMDKLSRAFARTMRDYGVKAENGKVGCEPSRVSVSRI